jgi:hypothetical protein
LILSQKIPFHKQEHALISDRWRLINSSDLFQFLFEFLGDTATANPNFLYKFTKLGIQDSDSELEEEISKKNKQIFDNQNEN